MKKDLFNGKVKHEYFAYICTSIIVVSCIFIGFAVLSLILFLEGNLDRATKYLVMGLGTISCFVGFGCATLSVYTARKYPKYPKLRRLCFDSDCYFVGDDAKEFYGHRRGRAAFEMTTYLAEQNKGLENIKYPRAYRVYIILVIVGIILTFGYLAAACIVLENIDMLPQEMQSEGGIFAVFMIADILNVALCLILAFRIRKIREMTIKEYREKQRANSQIED